MDLKDITIIKPGPRCLLQDLGRSSYLATGFTQSGALDEHAFLWANRLLDNAPSSPSLEITLGPFSCTFSCDARIAITGACKSVLINGERFPTWKSFRIHAGDALLIEPFGQGMLSYLSVAGGIQCEKVFGSAAMCPKEKSGPMNGMPLKSGDTLQYAPVAKDFPPIRWTPSVYQASYNTDQLKIHVIPCNSIEADCLYEGIFSVSPDSNRMACKLLPNSPLTVKSQEHMSSGVPLGTIQLPPDGNAIILMKDRQTIGGYPVAGCVSQLDTFKLAQARAGQRVHFVKSNLETHQKEVRNFYNFFCV